MRKFNLGLKYSVEVKDKNGKTTFKKTGISKSLVRNFMFWLKSFFDITAQTGTGAYFTTADILDFARTLPYANTMYIGVQGWFGVFGAPANTSSLGLRVGLNDTSVTPEDFEMGALIAHGTSSNEMVYGAQTVEAVTIVGSTISFRVSRPFTNNSGSIITVKEIGAALGMVDSGNTLRSLLYLHDILPAPVDVPDGSTFTLRYTFAVII
jgi:hypothetical protein